MAWKWIPGQITATVGDTDQTHQNASHPEEDFYMPGYYVGTDADEGRVLVYVDDESISRNHWVILEYPTLKLKVTEHWHDGTENEFEMTVAVGDGTIQTSDESDPEGPVTYGGKYRFISTSGGNTNLVLSYSLTQGTYIICNQYSADAMRYGYEPAYSVNELTGGVKGEYFWKPAGDLQDINWDTEFPITFNLAGNVEELTEQSNYRESYTIDLSENYFAYSTTGTNADLEVPPAGEYTNSKTQEKIYVGLKAFKGSDNSLWVAANLGKTRTSGSGLSSGSEKWYSSSHGGVKKYLGYIPNDQIWRTAHDSKEPYYESSGHENTLAEVSSLTLAYFEWNEDQQTYVADPSKNLTLQKGPMANMPTDTKILMGDYSQWRM